MSTLQELVHYCSEEHHLGALLLTGEWGCGKTYLIEQELSEALRETHYIVRVSLLALDSVEALNNAVKKQWLAVCTPFLGKLDQERDKMKKYSSFISGIDRIREASPPNSWPSILWSTSRWNRSLKTTSTGGRKNGSSSSLTT